MITTIRTLFLASAGLMAPLAALAMSPIPVVNRHVPFPDARTDRHGIALDLDGDGRQEFVGLATGDFPVLHIIARHPQSGAVIHLGGAPLPISYSYGRLKSFRIPGTTRDALVVLEPLTPAEGGRIYEGKDLGLVRVLPRFNNEAVLAVAPLDPQGPLSVFTSGQGGISRWSMDGGNALATIDIDACDATVHPFCRLAQVAQLDGDAPLELIVAGASVAVLDAMTLQPSWQLAYGYAADLRVVNIDADAQSEWLVLRGSQSTIGVFDHESANPLREIPCDFCYAGFATGDVRGADGRDELVHGNDPTNATDLNTGVSTSIGAGMVPREAVNFDGDSTPELVTYYSGDSLVRVRSSTQATLRAQFVKEPPRPIRQFGSSRLLLPQAPTDTTAGQIGVYSMLSGGYEYFYPPVQNWQVLREVLDIQFANANGDGVEDIVLLTDLSVNALSGTNYSLLWRIEPQMTPQRRYPMRFVPAQLDADAADEYLVTLSSSIEAWDGPSGQVMWSIVEPSFGATNVLETHQLDGDSGLELLISERDNLMVYDIATRSLTFRRQVLRSGAATAVHEFEGVRRIYASTFDALLVLDGSTGMEVHRFDGFPYLRGLVAIPGSKLMVGTTNTHAVVFDSQTGVVSRRSELLDAQIDTDRKPVIRPGPQPGYFRVDVIGRTVFSQLEIELPLFIDEFE